MSKEAEKQEDWIQKKWRPMMAVMYMMVCIFDFVVFPIMFTGVQFWEVEAVNDAFRQWNPITLGGGGLFHVAMGAVLGVTAWSRGQEKIAGAAVNPTPTAPISMPMASQDISVPSVSAPMKVQSQDVRVGYGGKMAPPDAPQPLI